MDPVLNPPQHHGYEDTVERMSQAVAVTSPELQRQILSLRNVLLRYLETHFHSCKRALCGHNFFLCDCKNGRQFGNEKKIIFDAAKLPHVFRGNKTCSKFA